MPKGVLDGISTAIHRPTTIQMLSAFSLFHRLARRPPPPPSFTLPLRFSLAPVRWMASEQGQSIHPSLRIGIIATFTLATGLTGSPAAMTEQGQRHRATTALLLLAVKVKVIVDLDLGEVFPLVPHRFDHPHHHHRHHAQVCLLRVLV